jgi:hypothetical protein
MRCKVIKFKKGVAIDAYLIWNPSAEERRVKPSRWRWRDAAAGQGGEEGRRKVETGDGEMRIGGAMLY